jgi:hypothetical protein
LSGLASLSLACPDERQKGPAAGSEEDQPRRVTAPPEAPDRPQRRDAASTGGRFTWSLAPCDGHRGRANVAKHAAQATWAGLAQWRSPGIVVQVPLNGTPPKTIERVRLDGCALDDAPRDGRWMILRGRSGQAPMVSPLIRAGIIHLGQLMAPGRPGVRNASAPDVRYALKRALTSYLRGRAVAVHHPALAGERRTIAGVRVRFMRKKAPRGVTLCVATQRGRLRYVAGYAARGDARGRPQASYQGFQVAFLRAPRSQGGRTHDRHRAPPPRKRAQRDDVGSSIELLGLVHPKAHLRGRCPGAPAPRR